MSFTSSTRVAGPFNGNGVTTVFAFSFKVFSSADMLVVLTSTLGVETVKTLTTHYTVSLNADQNNNPGGTITMLVAPANGEKLTVSSQVAETQPLVIRNQSAYYPKNIEDALDRGVILTQQLADQVARSLSFPISDGSSLTSQLPSAANRANKGLRFDASGNVGVSAGDPDTVLADTTAQAAAAAASASAAAASAVAAALSETNAGTSAGTASTQAGIATTQAGVATTQAGTATTQAGIATAAAAALTAVANSWQYSTTTTMADPGTGFLRFNNATLASATAVAISALAADSGNPNLRSFINTWDDSTTTSSKGYLVLRKSGAPATFAIFLITGAVTDNTTWAQMTLTYVTGNGTFSASDTFYVGFSRTGDQGAAGSGSGDASTNTATSVANELVQFADTTGKLLKRMTGTGVVTVSSGVASAASSLGATLGGTGQTTATQGDIIYASAANTWSKLAKSTTATHVLLNTGTSNNPAWGQVPLASGVTGTLPYNNGGTGQTTYALGDIVYATAVNTLGKLAMGTALQQLRVNAGATALEWATPASGGAFSTGSVTLTTGTSWSVPAGVNVVLVVAQAAGGGGGGWGASSSGGSGGGGGGTVRAIMQVTPLGTVTYAIGAAGTGGNSSGTDGTAGGDTTFGPLTAKGGSGGSGSTAGGNAAGGGSASITSSGLTLGTSPVVVADLIGGVSSSSVPFGSYTPGGNSMYGNGGNNAVGGGKGAGGSGAVSASTAGFAGAPGAIYILY